MRFSAYPAAGLAPTRILFANHSRSAGFSASVGRDLLEHLTRVVERSPSVPQPEQFLPDVGLPRDRLRTRLPATGREPPSARDTSLHRAGHRRALVAAEDDRPLRADRVEHRPHVLHPRLEVRKERSAVGEAGTALVEQDQPERLREPFVERAPVPRLPVVDEVGEEVRHEHQVGRGIADDVVRDRDVAVPGRSGCRAASLRRRHRASTRPGTPFSSCVPRSSNSIPEPATRSLTVCETRTSPGPARLATRAPVCTASPRPCRRTARTRRCGRRP